MDVTEWLLDSDPSIRWQVMRDLLDAPPGEVAAERARIATEGWGAKLLALQSGDGYWGGDEYGIDGARTSVTWTLHLLRRLGIDPDAPQTRSAIARVRDGVVWREWGDLPYFHGEVEECVNGGVLALAAYFGELGAGSDRIIPRLLQEQLDDDGWNCEPREESDRSSFDSTLCVLEGLLAYEQAVPGAPPEIAASRRRGEEYLLERGLFRRRSTGEIVLPRYANLIFPPYWVYDVLRSLDYFRTAHERPDPRIADAIDLVVSQGGGDGRWPAGSPWRGEVHFAVDAPEGEPSRWNTVRALRVLRWYEGR
ncbi:hypothetical protein DCE93_02565 [Agromyces badenianii]|uniref:Squalene cyclase n=1 Tax=Agromyces badenianii TaxID=2080742 RepID=A0A2S0WTL3_9MICO|nr:hypothetical protein [Agromyces badenianii]AWB94675.1 hypothetical protein DCE93_02565 [Agromyces badenianii]